MAGGGPGWLERVTCAARPALAERVLVVVAHPDDETLGCGAILPRLPHLTIVHVTDGAPRDGGDARRHGFASPVGYAAARRRELDAALAAGGIRHARLSTLGIPDQGAAFRIADIARALAPFVEAADVVLTHALEGGHPDHDATALAVGAACRLSGAAPLLVEMPLYRAGPDGSWLRGSFETGGGMVLDLSDRERALKEAMLAAHASQAATLAGFDPGRESYRVASPPDVSRLPNGGDLLYERYGWGLTGARWLELAAAAWTDLGIADPWR